MRSLLMIGDSRGAEARALCSDVLAACPGWRVVRCCSVDEALRSDAVDADVVLVLQTHPRAFSSAAFGGLHNAFPLARLLVGLGAWCGSAPRREGVWPESAVLPIWDVVERLRQAVREIESGTPPLPITAGREELASRASERISLPAGMAVSIDSPDRELREWLADLVRDAGGLPCIPLTAIRPAGVIWDVDPWDVASRGRRDVCGPVVALAGLPTQSLSRELLAAGATVVLGKPCDGENILRALSDVNLKDH